MTAGARRSRMNRLEFHMAYVCTNRCVFCSEKDRMRRFRRYPITRRAVERVLKEKREEGFQHVTFTGGEPTLFPRFWQVLRFAKDLGYRTLVITNGSALAIPASVRKCVRRSLISNSLSRGSMCGVRISAGASTPSGRTPPGGPRR